MLKVPRAKYIGHLHAAKIRHLIATQPTHGNFRQLDGTSFTGQQRIRNIEGADFFIIDDLRRRQNAPLLATLAWLRAASMVARGLDVFSICGRRLVNCTVTGWLRAISRVLIFAFTKALVR